MAEYTNIVPPRIPFLDEDTGFVSREWYQFFFNLFKLTGSGTNSFSLNDLQLGPPAIDVQSFPDFGLSGAENQAVQALTQTIPDLTTSTAETNALQALTMTQDDTLNWLGLHT